MMFRSLSLILAFIVMFVALAPTSRAFDHPGDSTPEASPEAGAGHDNQAMSGTGAAYMVIRNAGAEDDRLVGGSTDVAETIEVHQVVDEAGLMKMIPQPDGLVIPAGGEATLEPGGYHFMLFGLKEDLTNGKTFDVTLRFEQAGDVTVPVSVRPRAELAGGATPAEPVVAGDLTIEDAWSRPAPALGGGMVMGTPEATPAS